jgi:hypothetical protein
MEPDELWQPAFALDRKTMKLFEKKLSHSQTEEKFEQVYFGCVGTCRQKMS